MGLVCALGLGSSVGLAQNSTQNSTPERATPPAQTTSLWERPSLNFYGVPGLIDMPGAHQAPDADLAFTIGGFESTGKITTHFQFTERLSGVFRYSYVDDLFGGGDYYDRSFDLRYQIAEEGQYTPAVTIGLQDFGGTGIFAGEYIVAGKTFGPLRATAGLGWGRFGSYNSFENPFGRLQNREGGGGLDGTGQPNIENWFRGDMAFFGGLEYAASEKLRFTAEYSSDDYTLEQENIDFPKNSPFNFGMTYAPRPDTQLRLAYLYGSSIGAQLTYVFNPKDPQTAPRGRGPGPLAVGARPSAADLGWTADPQAPQTALDAIEPQLTPDGIRVDRLTLGATRAELRIRNSRLPTAQAVGRSARVLARTLPGSIETFEIVPVTGNGQAVSRIEIARSDVEELVNAPDGAWQSFARTRIDDSYGADERGVGFDIIGSPVDGDRKAFTWAFGPYVEGAWFDPDSPVRLDFGLQARARWEPLRGMIFAGEVRHRLAGNIDELRASDSELPRVRSDANLYYQDDTTLRRLTAAQYFRAGPDLYGRVTLGYLESMYAGVSGEVLWKPVDSRLALGTEINYARQRDFDQGFGLQDYDTVTGHVSAYYKTTGDYHYQLDIGRYLAEDWGGTLSIDRQFDNGTSIGVFATLTDVPFDEFGEGSFDKGFRISIPVSVLSGAPSNRSVARTIRPVQRDGGARLAVPGRLYNSVRSWHEPALQSQWGRVWQ